MPAFLGTSQECAGDFLLPKVWERKLPMDEMCLGRDFATTTD
jgi:hypothetical protein